MDASGSAKACGSHGTCAQSPESARIDPELLLGDLLLDAGRLVLDPVQPGGRKTAPLARLLDRDRNFRRPGGDIDLLSGHRRVHGDVRADETVIRAYPLEAMKFPVMASENARGLTDGSKRRAEALLELQAR